MVDRVWWVKRPIVMYRRFLSLSSYLSNGQVIIVVQVNDWGVEVGGDPEGLEGRLIVRNAVVLKREGVVKVLELKLLVIIGFESFPGVTGSVGVVLEVPGSDLADSFLGGNLHHVLMAR